MNNFFRKLNRLQDDFRPATVTFCGFFGLTTGIIRQTVNNIDEIKIHNIPLVLISSTPEMVLGGIMGYFWVYTSVPVVVYTKFFLFNKKS